MSPAPTFVISLRGEFPLATTLPSNLAAWRTPNFKVPGDDHKDAVCVEAELDMNASVLRTWYQCALIADQRGVFCRGAERLSYWRERIKAPQSTDFIQATKEWEVHAWWVWRILTPAVVAARRFLRLVRQVIPRLEILPELYLDPWFSWKDEESDWSPIVHDPTERVAVASRRIVTWSGKPRATVSAFADRENVLLQELREKRMYAYAPLDFLSKAREATDPSLRLRDRQIFSQEELVIELSGVEQDLDWWDNRQKVIAKALDAVERHLAEKDTSRRGGPP